MHYELIAIVYLVIWALVLIVPAAVIIGLAVKRKKEEEQKRMFYAQMLANSERRPPVNGGYNAEFYRKLELSLKENMQRGIQINPSGNGRGTLLVEFFSDEELADFAERLAGKREN